MKRDRKKRYSPKNEAHVRTIDPNNEGIGMHIFIFTSNPDKYLFLYLVIKS